METSMHILKSTLAVTALCAGFAISGVSAQEAIPSGTYVDQWGTSFEFSACGDAGTDLCAVMTNLAGDSATEENLQFVGQQVIQAPQTASNEWKGQLNAGGMSGEVTLTQTGADTVDITGCRAAVLCQTLTYTRAS